VNGTNYETPHYAVISTRNSLHSQCAVTLFCSAASNNRWGQPQSQAVSWITRLRVRTIDWQRHDHVHRLHQRAAQERRLPPSNTSLVLTNRGKNTAFISGDQSDTGCSWCVQVRAKAFGECRRYKIHSLLTSALAGGLRSSQPPIQWLLVDFRGGKATGRWGLNLARLQRKYA
jgi:hypothetical protein